MKREFSIGDTAHLSKPKRMGGYSLPVGYPMTITSHKKISAKHGAYIYSVRFAHPKNGETIEKQEWFTQFDFLTKKMAEKMQEQERIIRQYMKG